MAVDIRVASLTVPLICHILPDIQLYSRLDYLLAHQELMMNNIFENFREVM
jgi:hypothetical protein